MGGDLSDDQLRAMQERIEEIVQETSEREPRARVCEVRQDALVGHTSDAQRSYKEPNMNERRRYARSAAAHCNTPRSDVRRAVISLALCAGIATWSADTRAAPVTQADAETTSEDTLVDVPVLNNDFDGSSCFGPCPPPLFNIGRVVQPANGTVSIIQNPGGGPDIARYTPQPNFFGTDTFTYTAFDFQGVESSPETVTMTVTPVNDPPTSVDDTATTSQGNPVTIGVLANDTDVEGSALIVASLTQPFNGSVAIAGSAVTYTPNTSFSGTDQFTYRASDGAAISAAATVVVTVTPNVAPIAVIAGGSRTILDSDRRPGEDVRLDGSASTDPDGTIVSYQWFNAQQTLIGTGPTIDVRLPDGDNVIRLVVTDNNNATGSSTATLAVAMAPPRTSLQSLPNLTPNERSVAVALDDLCLRLTERTTLTEGESELLARCDAIVFDNDPARQTDALGELGAQDLNAIRTQTLLFARSQSMGVMDRLMALRSGAQGLSIAPGLNLVVDGTTVPPTMLESAAKHFLGGGASADDRKPGGLLGDQWGLWARGNYSFGEKQASSADRGFDADEWGITGGIDYRIPEQQAVLGLAIGLGEVDASFNPSGEGGFDTSAWSVSVYGGVYPAGSFYADGFANYGRSSLDAERRIHYTDADGPIDRTAQGSTDGSTLSAGVAVGHDFLIGQLTVSPNAGIFYTDATVDGFRESGAPGLDLIYEKQDFESVTANVGVRIAAAWNLGWGVLLPHFRGEFVREFRDGVEVFGVRFANDPFADAANPTPPIIVTSDAPDQSYLRLAAGVSAQFEYGFSGYVEYQRLHGFEFVDFVDIALGIRAQYSFR